MKLFRTLCITSAFIVGSYFTLPTSVFAQTPEVYLAHTVISGDVTKTEATEGDLILIAVKSNIDVSSATNVMVTVAQSGDYYTPVLANTPLANQFTHGTMGSNTVTIASGRNIAFIGVATKDDEFDESNGSISFTITSGSGYSVGSVPTKTINVNDNEPDPKISISTKYTTVSGSDYFEVSVISNKKSKNTFAVNLTVSTPVLNLIASQDTSATVNFAAKETITTHRVPIVSTVASGLTSAIPITVSIDPSDAYNVDKSKQSVQVNVVNGTSLPTVSISANSPSVSEGSPAGFRITVSPENPDGKIINLGISSMGDFVYRTPADTIEVPVNMVTADYLVPTVSDGSSGSQNGSITVTLEPGDGYKLPPLNQMSAMTTVSDDGMAQKPILFIENKVGVDSASVGAAGANAEFTVFSNVNAGNNFSIQARATNLDGNFLGIHNQNRPYSLNFSPVTGQTNLFSANLPIPIIRDVSNRKSGEIKVVLVDMSSAMYSVFAPRGSATLQVRADTSTLPVVSVTGGSEFEEGDSGVFYLQSDRTPASTLMVSVSLTDPSSFLTDSSNRMVQISSTERVPLLLPTLANNVDESDGTVTATVVAESPNPTTYDTDMSSSATIAILDNDVPNKPVITVAGPASIEEGQDATFVFTATPTPDSELVVDFDILVEGNFFPVGFVSDKIEKTVTIDTDGEGRFSQATIADIVAEVDGSITAFIRTSKLNPTSYSVGTQFSAEIAIEDNDIRYTPNQTRLPIMSVVASEDIVEGHHAIFSIKASEHVVTDMPVRIFISQNGDFLDADQLGIKTITFEGSPADNTVSSQSNFHIYQLATELDLDPEPSGSVSLTILSDSNTTQKYTVGADSRATVMVQSNDALALPTLSIESDSTEIQEGQKAFFTITTSRPITEDLLVGFKLIDSSDNFDDDAKNISAIILKPTTTNILYQFNSKFLDEPSTIEIYPNDSGPPNQYKFSLGTKLNGIISDSNKIGVQILRRTGYQVGANFKAEYSVLDANTRIKIYQSIAEVNKGSNALFHVSARSSNLSHSVPVTVKIGVVANPGKILEATEFTTELTLVNGTVTKEFSIPIPADTNNVYEPVGRLIVFIKNPRGTDTEVRSTTDKYFEISGEVSVLKIIDDDVPDGISILPLSEYIVEGQPAKFQIVSKPTGNMDRTISLSVTENSTSYINGTYSEIVIPAYTNSVNLVVKTNNSLEYGAPGVITATINTSSDNSYSLATTSFNASVTVRDSNLPDITVPDFTVSKRTLRVIEGQQFEFSILADPPPKVNFDINLKRLDSYIDDYNDTEKQVTFGSSSYRFMANEDDLKISGTAPSSILEDTSIGYAIEIISSEGRTVVSTQYLTILVLDADAPAQSKVSVGSLESSVVESNSARFEVSIDYGTFSTVENGAFVTKSITDAEPILVNFRLSENGNVLPDFPNRPNSTNPEVLNEYYKSLNSMAPSFKDCSSDFTTLQFSCWVNKMRTFEIPTTFGSGTRALSFQILEGNGGALANYRILKDEAVINVTDSSNNSPVISIESTRATSPHTPQSEFELGRNLRFKINAPASAETTITILVEDPSGVVIGLSGLASHQYKFPFETGRPTVLRLYNGGQRHFNLFTKHPRNQPIQADGIVTVKILPPGNNQHANSLSNYLVGSPAMSQVVVKDPRTPTTGVSIFPAKSSILGGEMAIFNVKSNTNFTRETTVSVLLDQSNSNIIAGSQGLTQKLVFEAGTRSKLLRIKTNELSPFADSETITATLQSSSDYTLVTATQYRSAQITVNSYQQNLIASVENVTADEDGTLETSIAEGEIAYFEFALTLPRGISSYKPPKNGINMGFTFEDAGGFVIQDDSLKLGRTNIVHFGEDIFNIPLDTRKSELTVARVVLPIHTGFVAGSSAGSISITLSDPTNFGLYVPARTPKNRATISVTHSTSTLPELSIELGVDPQTNQQVDSIVEGGMLRSVISVSPAVTNSLEVLVGVSQTGNYIYTGSNTPTLEYLQSEYDPTDSKILAVMIQSGKTEYQIETPVGDDRIGEDDGSVTFSILNQEDYNVEINKNSVTVNVMDNDRPRVSISSTVQTIAEGKVNSFEYKLMADPVPEETIMIAVKITGGEDFIMGTPKTTIPMTTSGMATGEVMLEDDKTPDDEDTIQIEVIAGIGYNIVSNNTPNTALSNTIEILLSDSDTTLSITSSEDALTEGTDLHASFTITAASAPLNNMLIFNYTPVSESFLPSTIESGKTIISESLTFSTSAPFTTTLSISIDNDNIAEENGSIKVSLAEADSNTGDYVVAPGDAASATIRVSDDDALVPVLSIMGPTTGTLESVTHVDFVVIANNSSGSSIDPGRAIAVNYTVADDVSEDYLASTEEGTKTTEPKLRFTDNNGTFTATIRVNLVDDSHVENTGMISVVLNDDPADPDTYTIASDSTESAMATILDDDGPPELTISAGADVFELTGAKADFIITASFKPKTDLAVRYTPVGTDFLVEAVKSGETISANPPLEFKPSGDVFTSTLSIDIDVDEVDDPDGVIMVTLEEQAAGTTKTYTVGSPASASVKVSEYELSIADTYATEPNPKDLIAGNDHNEMIFTVTLSPAANERISVNWSITGVTATLMDDFQPMPSAPLVFMAGESTKEISVLILADDEDEDIETFTVMLNNQTAGVVLSKATAEGQILPNDVDPSETDIFVEISAVSNSVQEGTPAVFALTTKQGLPSNGLVVQINVTETGSFIAWRAPRSIHMTKVPELLSIGTQNDLVEEPMGMIRVEIIADPDETYRINEENDTATATVMVTSEDVINPEEPPEEQPRISVAHTVVDAIIDFLNSPQQGSPALSPAESVAIQTRPTVSISSVDTKITEGESAIFLISTKSGGSTVNITVSLQVQQTRVQIEGPTSMEIQLGSQDTRSVSIATINDGHADEDGIISLSISESPDYLVSTTAGSAVVKVSDAIDRQNRKSEITARTQSFLPELTGVIGANTLETVSNRIDLGFSEESNQELELGGQNSISGMLTASGDAINESSTTLKLFLGNSSFAISLSDDEFAIPTTFWGLGDYQKLSTIDDGKAFDWSGDLFMGHFGIDALIREGVLAGVSASVAESEIKFGNIDTNNIEFDIRTTSLNPYIGWTSTNQNSKVHATAGFGLGEIGVDQNAYSYETLSSESYSYGLSGSQVLFTSDKLLSGTSNLSVKGESCSAHQKVDGKDGVLENVSTNSQHFRIRTEGTHQFDFATGSTLSPLVSIGVRNDEMDHLSVLGLEFTGGADYNNPIGLTLSGQGSMLIGQASQVQKIGLNSSVNYDLNGDKQGVLFELETSWGQTETEIQDSLWTESHLHSANVSGSYSNDTRLNTELGYGLNILDNGGTLAPFTGLEFSQHQGNEYFVGTRVKIGSNAQIDLSGTQNVNSTGYTSNKVRLEGSLSW